MRNDEAQLISNALLELWQQLEDDTLADMARRISKAGKLTDTAVWQAWRLEQTQLFRTDLVKRLAQTLGKSEAEVRRLLQEAGTENLLAVDEVNRAAGQTTPPLNDSAALKNLLNAGAKQTNGTLYNLTATTANTATGQFERALDRAWMQVSSGAFDYQSVVRKTVAELARSGLEAVRYPTGHTDSLEVAVRRAVVTGVNSASVKLQIQRCKEMGCDLVEVSAHTGARPSHAAWQGKIYSISGESAKYPALNSATGYGTGGGLGGWNCRHRVYPYWEGLSEPTYSAQQLKSMDAKTVEYQGRKYSRYQISQQQRALERSVRRYKRQYTMEEAAGLDSTGTAVKLKTARQKLQDFVAATDGQMETARTGVNGFGRSQASKATWQARKAMEEG